MAPVDHCCHTMHELTRKYIHSSFVVLRLNEPQEFIFRSKHFVQYLTYRFSRDVSSSQWRAEDVVPMRITSRNARNWHQILSSTRYKYSLHPSRAGTKQLVFVIEIHLTTLLIKTLFGGSSSLVGGCQRMIFRVKDLDFFQHSNWLSV